VSHATTSDGHQAAEFRKKLDTMVIITADVKKRYDTSRDRVLAATALLEEEERTTVILT
jgi:hypothetical protein